MKDRASNIEITFNTKAQFTRAMDIDAKLIENAYIGIAPINSRQAALNVAKYVTKA